MINPYTKEDKSELISVWESSVIATHHFLSNKHIEHIKSILEDMDLYSFEIKLYKTTDHKIAGFIGTKGHKINMLFIHPDFFRMGIGTLLISDAIEQKNVREVVVNKQNPDAILFYQSFGFQITARSNRDEQGNPFPIVIMHR